MNLSYLKQKYISYIIPSLSLTVALAWNSAFQTFFKENPYLNKYGRFGFAIILTFLILTIILFLEHANE